MPYKDYKDDVIWRWKNYGIKTEDWDSLYDRYINTDNCEVCEVELIEGNFGTHKKVIDHNHETGEVRYICCHGCNMNIEKMTYKNNKLSEKNITFAKNKYIVRKQFRGKKISKRFATLEEAKSFRDTLILSESQVPTP